MEALRLTKPLWALKSSNETLLSILFARNYASLIEGLLRKSASSVPSHFYLEIRTALDADSLVHRVIETYDHQISKLQSLKGKGIAFHEKSVSCLAPGIAPKTILKEARSLYPYLLNPRKPLDELYAELPEEVVRWEIEGGVGARARELWVPLLESIKFQRQQVLSLFK